MGTTADRVVLIGDRNSIRGPLLVRAAILTVLGAMSVAAHADNGALYVAPGPSTLISADLIKRNQEQLGRLENWVTFWATR